ncbi:MAG: hypothetical protein HQL59_09745 [Magnetococcales bacterium]|nr:hypothetical protein [Magnetococcales bacterium]
MNRPFSLEPQWQPSDHGTEEVRQTTALLRITVNGRLATRADNDWTRSVGEAVPLSCYPLAIWLASSWWRLIWEPTPGETRDEPSVEWRMAHEMAGAGGGFLWPPLCFDTDGEVVTVRCQPSAEDASEPVRYLGHFRELVPVADFARGIEAFVQLVLARLDSVGIRESELHLLWRELSVERGEAEAAAFRRLEALLGFEPDEAPDGVADFFQRLSLEVGEEAVAEVAAAFARPGSGLLRDRVLFLERPLPAGLQGSLASVLGLREDARWICRSVATPWDRGRDLARGVRKFLGFGSGPLPDDRLGEILGLTTEHLARGAASLGKVGLSLAVKSGDLGEVRFLFRRSSRTGRRFEAARWLGDVLMAPPGDRWLPATDTKTARQKGQRAFAAELLAPIEPLASFLGKELNDPERIEEAGDYFGVSTWAINSQLDNQGLRPSLSASAGSYSGY